MFNKFQILQMAFGLASHAAARQSAVAGNIAQADTPGYRALDIQSFADSYQSGQNNIHMRATRPQHFDGALSHSATPRFFRTDDPVSPNGNSVSLETEMVKASELRHQHELALSVYSTSLNILRTSLGRR